MIILVIALIIAVIILANNYSDEKERNRLLTRDKEKLIKENGVLKQEIAKLKEGMVQTQQTENKPYQSTEATAKVVEMPKPQKEIPLVEKNIETHEKVRDRQKEKNTSILISGAILIVLSAIVFLLSTWNTTPDIIKTGVLTLLVGVFMGASVLADKKFHLEQTSKTFYYIAMAYIPLVVLSISIFGFFGDYLSIHGDGCFIYFTISGVFLSLLYGIESYRKEEIPIWIASLACQLLSVIFFVLIFTKDIQMIILGVSIYHIIFSQWPRTRKTVWREFQVPLCQALYVILYIILVLVTIPNWIFANGTFIPAINFLLLFIQHYAAKMKKEYSILKDLSILAFVFSFLSYEGFHFVAGIKLLVMSATVMIMYTLKYLSTGELINKIIVYVSSNVFCYAILEITNLIEHAKYIPFVTTLLVILIEKLKSDDLVKYYIVLSFIATFVGLNLEFSIINFILLLIASAAFWYEIHFYHLEETYLCIPMIAIIPSVFSSSIFNFERMSFNVATVIALLLIVGTTVKSVLRKEISLYTIASIVYFALSFAIFQWNIYAKILLVIAWSAVHIFTQKQNNLFKVILYVAGLLLYNQIVLDVGLSQITLLKCLGYLACIFLISRTVVQNVEGPYEGIELAASSIVYAYAITQYTGTIDAGIFIGFLLIMILLGYMKKIDSLYAASLVAVAVLWNKLLIDLSYTQNTLLLVIGYLIAIYGITRVLLKKTELPYKVIEYIGTSIIYLYALFNYSGIVDAMIFIGFLVLMVFTSFSKKMGPLFLTSLVAIVVNFIKLTKDFWTSIPWWVYLLVVGTGLLVFAIRNEANAENHKNKVNVLIQKLKDQIDI